MNMFFITLSILIGGMAGLALAKLGLSLFHLAVRDLDKAKIRTAITKEDYYNQLYEECLTEELDKKAEQAAREMGQYDY